MHFLTAAPASPLVALVGRPNVGKSTLFNRLVRRRQALMHDEPGVTRDRLFGAFEVHDAGHQAHVLRLVDTGGLVPPGDDALAAAMMQQTKMAIDEAALVLLVVDARAGLLPDDAEAARMLHRSGTPFCVVANKVDVAGHEGFVAEFYALGCQDIVGISAEHARNIDEVRDYVAASLAARDLLSAATVKPPEPERRPLRGLDADGAGRADGLDGANDASKAAPAADGAADALEGDEAFDDFDAAFGDDADAADEVPAATEVIEWDGGAIRVAVVGRPNAGKSSLINAVLGHERLVASPEAGTTRDVIDTACEVAGQPYVLVDTAGIRRQRAVQTRLEGLMVHMARASLERADVVVLVVDATQRPSEQDAKIAAMAHERGCGLVLAANKWDLIENPEWRERFVPAIRHDMPFISYAPVVPTSAMTNAGIDALFEAVLQVQKERHRRIGTGTLNRFFREVVGSHPPPFRSGARPQMTFISQPMVRPPTFVIATRRPATLVESYRRYLINALRQRFGFEGTPLWLKFRAPSGGRPRAHRPPPSRARARR